MTCIKYGDWKHLLRQERLPSVVVDLDAFDGNVRKLAEIAKSGSKRLRLATKSLRVPELIARALKYGEPYDGLMCYSAAEAASLSSLGLDDFLVAYPTVQPSDLHALREVHEKGKKVRVVVDGAGQIKALVSAMKGVSRPFQVVLEVDVSLRLFGEKVHLGVRRSPLRTPGEISALIGQISRHPELKLIGAMAYEAQVAGLVDQNPFKPLLNPVAKFVRKLSVRSVAKSRRAIAETFKAKGASLEIFNGAGTGSVTFAANEQALTEITAGSGLLCPHLFDYYSNIKLEPACFFALQVVRVPAGGFVTCQGGGYIASGEPGWDKVPVPYLPVGLKLVPTEGCGEVQTPLKLPPGVSLGVGDPVLFRHAKAGELAERFNEYLLVSGGAIVARAKTYRGMGWGFF